MNNIFRGLIAGYGAKKLGGGCFGTIIVFVIIWVALGQCSWSSDTRPAPETYPADRHVSAPAKIDNMSLLSHRSENLSGSLWLNSMASCTLLEVA
ncbi:MAG: hypothetical protein ABIR06_03635 [Cyclobacteriaceae bacterium]